MLGRLDSFAVGGALATARAQNLPHELLDADQVRRRFPAFIPGDDEVGLYEEIAGLVRPEAAIATLLRQARARGATFDLVSRCATGRRVRAASRCTPTQATSCTPTGWCSPRARGHPTWSGYRCRCGCSDGFSTTGVPPTRTCSSRAGYRSGSGATGRTRWPTGCPPSTVRVKAALHHGSEPVDPDRGAAPARADEVDAMREWLATRIPSLAEGGWLGSKPCLYTLTPDEHFVIGRHPEHAEVVIACGFSGHGFKFAPVVGEILADLTLAGQTRHDIALFDPARFATTVVG